MITFQQVLRRLQDFWSDYGCVIWQPHNVQVGAGTMNPATFLRVLGPEPWNVAYVEPSVRPDDGRYGDNPNRMQYYYQYQVILKPDPGNPQEVYLRSLDALGINRQQHDVRFVEDNWEQPAIGAWGLGWEVWLDGLEITQFTYFQQAGGLELEPNAVEITYGVERIVAALQGVNSVWEIQYNDSMTYGDVFQRNEWEYSTYYFEQADAEKLVEVYNTFEAEALRALDHEPPLVLPAHDYVLKCSHLFNELDTRGAIGVVERADYFRRMQRLASRVSRAFAEQRRSLDYPLLPPDWEVDEETGALSVPKPESPLLDEGTPPTEPAPFLFEIGVEELPADEVSNAVAQLRENVPTMLTEARLAHGEITVGGTPRRLVVVVEDLAPAQRAEEFVHRGPPVNRAYDEDGSPTRAAEGFARSQGVAVEDLEQEEIDGGTYVIARVQDEGAPAIEVLAERLPELVEGLRFGRAMRWNPSGQSFSRPIRWFVALCGEAVIPFEYAWVYSGRTTVGTRAADSPIYELNTPEDYLTFLREQRILIDIDRRREVIREQVEAIAEQVGGTIVDDPELLDEVTNLVEQPTAVLGRFAEDYLQLPDAVLMTVMRKHQRYFAVVDENGDLLPVFITVRNGSGEHLDMVANGNEQVVRARFSDARFFYTEDIKLSLEEYVEVLETLTFQEQLGSYREKVARLEGLSGRIAAMLGADDSQLDRTIRTARLSKADLVTQMVVEMTSLQGVIGREYALIAGEDPAVANAIAEHYKPMAAGGSLPQSMEGISIALADRLDSLIGLFAVGMQPSGTSDPYGLRRAALGVVQIVLGHGLEVSLHRLLRWAAQGYTQSLGETFVTEEHIEAVHAFMIDRLRVVLRDDFRHDVVEAVLAEQGDNPYRAHQHAEQLAAWVQHPDWEQTLDQFARCVRITRSQEEVHPVSPETLSESAEHDLFAALKAFEAELGEQPDVNTFLEAFQPLVPAISTFFAPPDEGGVLVMAEDPAVRANRLGLLQRIVAAARGVADFSQMEGF